MKKNQHDGDCTIYASLCNETATDGICTCGYGWSLVRQNDWSEMYSAEKAQKLSEYEKQKIQILESKQLRA